MAEAAPDSWSPEGRATAMGENEALLAGVVPIRISIGVTSSPVLFQFRNPVEENLL